MDCMNLLLNDFMKRNCYKKVHPGVARVYLYKI
jgi:hypothetical protein